MKDQPTTLDLARMDPKQAYQALVSKQAIIAPEEKSCSNPDCMDGWIETPTGSARCPDCKSRRVLGQLNLKTWSNILLEDDSWRTVKAYSDNLPDWIKAGVFLFLLGPMGRGKTQAAYLLKTDAEMQGYTTRAVKWPRWVEGVVSDWTRKQKTTSEHLEELIAPDLLIVDEWRRVMVKDDQFAQEQNWFNDVIDARYEMGRATVITGNLAQKDIEALAGARAFDRIKSCGDIIPFLGPSYREQVESVQVQSVIDRIRAKVKPS